MATALGDEGPLVLVVGLGGVGSHCAHALVRAGVLRIQLVDFDRVSLSSLNRHAVATRQDVGVPKVLACAEHFRAIRPGCTIETRDEMYTSAINDSLLGPASDSAIDDLGLASGAACVRPQMVIDCIDDVSTKADLLTACVQRRIHVLSALGSGAKSDPTKLCVARGLCDIENDPLATKLRKLFSTREVDLTGVTFVYSSQAPQRKLLPLSDEQRARPEEFGSVANFRLRVIPVLGTQPAVAGIALALQALLELGLCPAFHPRSAPPLQHHFVERLVERMRRREAKRAGCARCDVDLTVGEAALLAREIWRNRSAFNAELCVSGASGKHFCFTRWDPAQPICVDNVILCTEQEAEAHTGPDNVPADARRRIEETLRSAAAMMAPPAFGAPACAEEAGREMLRGAPACAEPAKESELQIKGSLHDTDVPPPTSLMDSEGVAKEEEALIVEQLSRSAAFFGARGQASVRGAFAIVVGLGAVGGAAAALLGRAGVRRLRLVDGSRLASGACHAVAEAADAGLLKVDICRSRFQAILPCCQVEAVAQHLDEANASQLLAPAADGQQPDIVIDCIRHIPSKAVLLGAACTAGLRAITVVPAAGLVDPTRVAVAPLKDVYACPAAATLRSIASQAATADVVHTNEPWQWLRTAEPAGAGLSRLFLGMVAAAVALCRISGEAVPEAPVSSSVGCWKKLQRGLQLQLRQQDGEPLDPLAVGCVVEQVWRGRSALSRSTGAPFGLGDGPTKLRLVRWESSRPLGLGNLALMTEEEATAHEAAGTEPSCASGANQSDKLQLQASQMIERLRWRIGQHFDNTPRSKQLELATSHKPQKQPWYWRGKTRRAATTCEKGDDSFGMIGRILAALGKPGTRATSDPDDDFFGTIGGALAVLGRSLVAAATLQLGRRATTPLCKRGTASVRAVAAAGLLAPALGWGLRAWGGSSFFAVALERLLGTPRGSPTPVPPHVQSGFTGLVGNTPLVELLSLSCATGCRIVAKAEFLSPGGCQKDRAAKRIIEKAELSGRLRPGATIVEGTSGSTGISLCLAAKERGYRVHIVMPDDQASEKVAMLRRFGAEVELVRPASITSPEHYVNVARRRADEINARPGSSGAIFADQFENEANFEAHYAGTGPELWAQCNRHLDAFVMSAGTGGTLAGVGRFLKERAPGVHVCLADVPGSSLYNKVVRGVLYAPEQAEQSIRRHRTDTIAEGVGLDRLTANLARGLPAHNGGVAGIDSAVRVSDQEALDMAHHILEHEGIFIGSSAAVNCAGAVKVARRLGPGHTVATVLCDSGLRHLTKFYNSDVWAEFGLTPPAPHAREDLSFIW